MTCWFEMNQGPPAHERVAGYRIGKDQSVGMPDNLQPGVSSGSRPCEPPAMRIVVSLWSVRFGCKPDVPISGIRPVRLHREAHGGGPTCTRRSRQASALRNTG